MSSEFTLKKSPENTSGKVSKPDRGKKDNPVFASRILKTFSSFFSPQKNTNGIAEEPKTSVKVEGSENVGNHKESHASRDHYIEEARSSARAQVSGADPDGINDAADDVIDVISGSDEPNDSDNSDVVEISGPNSLPNSTAEKAPNAAESEDESGPGKSRNVLQRRISVTQAYSIESTAEPEEIKPGAGAHVSLRMDQGSALQSEITSDNLEARPHAIDTQEHSGSQSPGISEAVGSSQRVLRPRNRPPPATPESPAESGEEASDDDLFIDAAETGSRLLRVPGKRPTRVPSGKYKCTYCGKQELCNSYLIRHMRKHTGEKPFPCTICDKRFARKPQLKTHIRTHTGEKPYGCKVCDKHFVSHSNRETHMSVHSTERPFACETCGKTFTRRTHLKNHTITHSGIKSFICTYCGKAFIASNNLQKHTRIHTGEKPYGCTLCHRSYASRESLVIHTRTHTGEKPFGCTVCGKHFAVARTLKIHTRVHTGERAYPCTLCEKRFAGSSALNVHMLTHTKERPHECVVCEKRFALSSNLSKHMRCHTGERPYKCTVCDRGYSSNIALRRHMGIHTEETPFECVLCGLKVSLKPTLAKHMKIHTGERPYKCSECGEKVLQKEPMIAHLLAHKEEDGVDFF